MDLNAMVAWLGTRPDLIIVAGALLMVCLVLVERMRASD